MMKTGKWFKSFWAGKKKCAKQQTALPEDSQSAPIQSPAPKDKKRWSFRRSTGAGKETGPTDSTNVAQIQHASEAEVDQKKHAKVVVAAAEAAVAAAKAADIVIRLSTTPNSKTSTIDEKAATKIQAVFRSYLARKALKALRGLVKLQALVRGHLVRKQATATLRCMHALVTVQARARAQRIHMVDDSQRQSIQRRSPSPQNQRYRRTNESERYMEENVKIVEMDIGEAKGNFRSRNGYSIGQNEKKNQRHFSNYDCLRAPYNADHYQQASPALSAITDISSRACSNHFGEFSFNTIQSSPQYYSAISKPYSIQEYSHYPQPDDTYSICNEHLLCPSYMANTESSRAKARSQSAPKQRPETCERQPSKRRPSVEGRNIPRGVRMQRSSSQVGQPLQANQYSWSIKLDKSNLSLKDSECGSTSTILTNAYCRSVAAYEGRDYRY